MPMPKWEPDLSIEPPSWLIEGARVSHTTFGLGVVGRVGKYKDVPTVWVDFDGGTTKALSLELGLPHLTLAGTETGKRRFFQRKQRN